MTTDTSVGERCGAVMGKGLTHWYCGLLIRFRSDGIGTNGLTLQQWLDAPLDESDEEDWHLGFEHIREVKGAPCAECGHPIESHMKEESGDEGLPAFCYDCHEAGATLEAGHHEFTPTYSVFEPDDKHPATPVEVKT